MPKGSPAAPRQADIVAPVALTLADDERARLLLLPERERSVRDAVLLRVHEQRGVLREHKHTRALGRSR